MRLSIVFFSATFTLLLLSACKTMQGGNLEPFISAGQKLVQSGDTSEADERIIGSHMAAALLGAAPLDKNEKTQRYVNRVGVYLASQSSRATLAWRFGVLDDDGYNAFAAPGGFIFITRGLLNDLQSEAELAGVLAHEITHVNKKHHLKAVQKNNRLGALTDVVGALGERRMADSGHGQLKADVAKKLLNASKELYARGLDKDDEFQADEKAISLMSNAGYDPYAFYAVLQRLESRSADDTNFALMFKTHPRAQERLNALDKTYANGFSSNQYAVLADRYMREVRK